MNSIDLHLNIQNSLLKTLKSTEMTMKSFNSLLEKSGKSFDKIGKDATQVSDHYDDIEKSQKKILKSTEVWGGSLSKIGDTVKHLVPGFLEIFTGARILNSIKAVMSLDKQMKDLSFRMGDAGKSTELLKNSVFAVTQATGASVDESAKLVEQLKELRVPNKYMTELATNTALYSQVTGVSADAAGQLTGELVRIGRLGPQSTTRILAGMVKMQRAVGMTSGEMTQLNDGLIQSTQMLSQMGKSASQITSFNEGVMKLAAGFTAVGLSATDANKFVTDLLDPSKVQDNALLYAKLGISLQDAFSGNINMNQVANGLKKIGQQMKSMSGPAAAAMAQQLGHSVIDLRQMADMPTDKLNKVLQGGKNGAATLTKAQSQQASAQDKFERSVNKLSGSMDHLMNTALMPTIKGIASLFSKIVDMITKSPFKLLLVGALILAIGLVIKLKKKFFSMATETKGAITTAVSEGMDQGSRAGAIKMRQNIIASARQADRAARVQQNPQYSSVQANASSYQTLAQGSNITKATARMTLNTGAWLEKISAGVKPYSKILTLTEQNNKKIQERLNFAMAEKTMQKEINADLAQDLSYQKNVNNERLAYLSTLEKTTAEQEYEAKVLGKQNINIEKQLSKLSSDRQKQDTRFNGLETNYIKRMSEEQIRAMKAEIDGQKGILQARVDASKESIKRYDASLALIQKEINSENITYMERKKLLEEQKSLNIEKTKEWDSVQATRKELTQQVVALNKINEIYKKNVDIGPGSSPLVISRIHKMTNFVKSAFNNAGAGLVKTFDKIKQSAHQIVKNLAARLNPKNWVMAARQRFLTPEGRAAAKEKRVAGRAAAKEKRAAGGGAFSGKGGMKMLGIMGLLAGFLLNSAPIQEALKQVMTAIQPFLNEMVNAVMPVIQQMIAIITPFIQTLISALVPAVKAFAGIFGKIGKILIDILIKIVKALMPALLRVLAAMFPMFALLVNKLLPPLLMVLGYVVKVIGDLIKFIMELPERITFALPKFLGGKGGEGTFTPSASLAGNPFYQVAGAISDAGSALIKTGTDLWASQVISNGQVLAVQSSLNKAADSIKNSTIGDPVKIQDAVTTGVKKGITTTQNNPADLYANNTGITVRHGASTITTTGNASDKTTAEASQSTADATQQTASTVSVMYKEQKDQQNKMLDAQNQTNILLGRLLTAFNQKL